MGKIQIIDNQIHFNYTPDFIAFFKELPPEMIPILRQLGKSQGYSPMLIFFLLIYQYAMQELGNLTFKPYRKALNG